MSVLFSTFNDPHLLEQLQRGAIGVVPTDTVYGIVTSAKNSESVARLYALKHRENKPGTIVAASIEQLVGLGLKARYLKAVSQFWPGAVSVVVPTGVELEYLHQGQRSLAVRIPEHGKFHDLLEQTGPLLTSSANLPGEPTAQTAIEAQVIFGEKLDFYVDKGPIIGHKPSTVIRMVDDAIEILRQGAVKINEEGQINDI